MSDEPVAASTSQNVSHSQDEITKSRGEQQKEARKFYDAMMSQYKSSCIELSEMVDNLKIGRKGLMTLKCLGMCCNKPTCHCKNLQFQLEHGFKKICEKLKTSQLKIWDTKLYIDHLTIEDLHPHDCTESDECLLKMRRLLLQDPLSLERKQFVHTQNNITEENIQHRCSPLHHAIRMGHVKCVEFLLENGANVTSITTYEEYTVVQTLYDPCAPIDDYERFNILKLLLKYGVADVFPCKESGQYALIMLCIVPVILEEIYLLLKNGASMNKKKSREAIVEAWDCFKLPLIRFLLLYHPKRLNFGPGSYVLCKKLIENCYCKMIVPGVPSEEYHEKVLEALQFYKAFGGKFPVCSAKDPDRDLMQFLRSYKHRRYFDGIELKIKALISNPLSLKEISRLAVRKCIRKDYFESVKELELPGALQSYLKFDDFTITELPDKYDECGDEGDWSSSSGSEGDSDIEL